MKLILLLILFLVQISYIKVGYGLNVENSIHIQESSINLKTSTKDSLKSKESPVTNLNIPLDGNSTDTNILNALASVLPLKSTSNSPDDAKDKEASDLSYFEPKVLYTTIPVIVICMVGIAVLAELFGDGFESGKRRLSMIPESVKRRGRASI
ncbi:hypothetical protein CPHLJ_8g3830 [Cryptosporidium parvum]|nr:Uncharacterized protein CPATCC_0004050 [Cryptosporidium parvum]WKS79645.1 hypothetical protein CPCDC_8g3830 [Cryptosporidium sp. 43IA8]WRK34147.1 Uncharacterized protein cpbgf_8003830 [Cryptosporidium parvum]|eukprot:QOY40149.1 hypothetical protein CPATCC_004239 [Cryptosporidium parvum]